jgi:transposase
MESAVRIQRSNGLQRGKNDSIDAKRIALYAMKNRADKVQWISINEGQVKLKDLMNLRKRLIQTKNALLAPIKELMSVEEKQRARMIQKNCNQSISSLINEISKVDQEIKKEMNKDVAISKNVKLLLSIPGVGMITSVAMVCATDNFTRFNDAKKLACHCGCAPFEHSSGTSIRGKNRVHFMANKELKTLLTLGATSIINSKNDMAIYYKRKVEEGKNKMSVINALRNKLVHRIISVIKRQSPYLPHINMLSQTIS